jgi:hypothetical protein
MDTQLMVPFITGVLGVVVAPVVTQVLVPLIKRWLKLDEKGDVPKAKRKRKPKRPILMFMHAGLGGIIGVLVGYALISPVIFSRCSVFAPTKVEITSPQADTSVPPLITVQGTTCNLPDRQELWLLVVPEGITTYHPQAGPIVVTSDGSWSASAYVGLPGTDDVGRGFVLIAALADQQSSATMRAYLSQGRESFPGIQPLPQGIRLMSQTRVVRR